MKRTVETMLDELHTLDKNGNYIVTYWGGDEWEITNRITHETMHTENGFNAVKAWMLADMISKES